MSAPPLLPTWPPTARGPLSAAVLAALAADPGDSPATDDAARLAAATPTGAAFLADGDAQLAYFLLAELPFGLPGVDDRWQAHPALAGTLRTLVDRFEAALRERFDGPVADELVPDDGSDATGLLRRIVGAPDPRGAAGFIARRATLEQAREMVVVRTPYTLKEADPHTLTIPRLRGAAKAALLEIQHDEYGAGHAPDGHARLFTETVRAFGLSPERYVYLDAVPTVALTQVNAITLFASHGWLRGALAGHFAVFEMGSSVPMGWYARGLERLGFGEAERAFFAVHVTADAAHELIALHDLVGGLLRDEPDLRADVLFGARVSAGLDADLATHLLTCWQDGRTALRTP